MKRYPKGIPAAAAGAFAIIVVASAAAAASERVLFASLGDNSRAPIGWIEFCSEPPKECSGGTSSPRDVVLNAQVLEGPRAHQQIRQRQHQADHRLDHWGAVEKWSYPEDGYGDCEDYVLLKRKTAAQAGWPREALLITVVREKSATVTPS